VLVAMISPNNQKLFMHTRETLQSSQAGSSQAVATGHMYVTQLRHARGFEGVPRLGASILQNVYMCVHHAPVYAAASAHLSRCTSLLTFWSYSDHSC
jgi:hypothetical protein